jgi:hypothetical protein
VIDIPLPDHVELNARELTGELLGAAGPILTRLMTEPHPTSAGTQNAYGKKKLFFFYFTFEDAVKKIQTTTKY